MTTICFLPKKSFRSIVKNQKDELAEKSTRNLLLYTFSNIFCHNTSVNC